jgi:hypothetical protein
VLFSEVISLVPKQAGIMQSWLFRLLVEHSFALPGEVFLEAAEMKWQF